MVSSRLKVDVEQARFNTFFLPGTWQALIICGQHIQQHTHAVPGTETDRCTTDCVWNAHMTLELQQNEEVKHLEIRLFRNQEYVCTAMVPLQENTGESQWYKLETSPGESCGDVKLTFTWTLQGLQIKPKGDPTRNAASYYSGRMFSGHVPPQHGTHVNNGGLVATPGSDRNGGYQQMPPVYGAQPVYQPQVPYPQRESYLEQQGHTYRPPQSIHGQYPQGYGGVAPHASHAHGVNTQNQYAGDNGSVRSSQYGAPPAGYGSGSYQHNTHNTHNTYGRNPYGDDDPNGYFWRPHH